MYVDSSIVANMVRYHTLATVIEETGNTLTDTVPPSPYRPIPRNINVHRNESLMSVISESTSNQAREAAEGNLTTRQVAR